jgi:transposase
VAQIRGCSSNIKKKTKVADEADPKERAKFKRKQENLPIERLVFIDEFGINLAMSRTRARSLRGERAIVREPFRGGVNTSVISALSINGLFAPMTIEGAMDSIAFDRYVEHFLVPELWAGDIIIMDNVPFHLSAKAISLIKAAGATVEYLPSYSPDLNPIEECISKIKASLRKAKARTKITLRNALKKAIDLVSPLDIVGWFIHAGYLCTLK